MRVIPISERDFMHQVVTLARLTQWRVYHTFDSRRSEPGFPDLVLLKPPQLLFTELKNEGGKLTVEQAEWLESLRLVKGSPLVKLWRPSDWDAIVATLQQYSRSS